MIREWLHRCARWIEQISWAAMLIALPVTSFPYFPQAAGGEALVRPLSIYPLILLLLFFIPARLLRKPLPKNLLALGVFVLVAIAASGLALTRGIEPALGISVESRVLRGILTLFIGCAFFVVVALLPDDPEQLRFSLRAIYLGLAAAMSWGTIQAYHILNPNPAYFLFLERIQRHLSIRRLRIDRISGATYEPNWFAVQIVLLLLPYTLVAVLHDYTVFKWRWRRLTIEALLLAWSLILLPFTFSRAGLLNLIIVLVLGILFFRPTRSGIASITTRRFAPVLRWVVEVSLLITLVAVPIYFIGSRNAFFARIWDYWKKPDKSLQGYVSFLGFDARLIYAQAAYNTYLANPFIGVGLGNYAFYFEEMLPNRPVAEVPEVLYMITPEPGRDRLITSKNFFLRLLAETGILGWITFGVFLLVNLGYALYLWLSPKKEWKYWGAASLCGLIAFGLSSLTFDSFVIPNMWVLLGLVTAAAHIASHHNHTTLLQIQ